jgi:hypothetical protein
MTLFFWIEGVIYLKLDVLDKIRVPALEYEEPYKLIILPSLLFTGCSVYSI